MSSSSAASNELLSAVHDHYDSATTGEISHIQPVKLEEPPTSPPAESPAAAHPVEDTDMPVSPVPNGLPGSQTHSSSPNDQNATMLRSGLTPEEQRHELINQTAIDPMPPAKDDRANPRSFQQGSIVDAWGEDESEQLLLLFDLGKSEPTYATPAARWNSLKVSIVKWLWKLSKRFEIDVAKGAILEARQRRIAAPERVRSARRYITATDVKDAYNALQVDSLGAGPPDVATGSSSAVDLDDDEDHQSNDVRDGDADSASDEETMLDEELEVRRQDSFSPTQSSEQDRLSAYESVKNGRKRWPSFRRNSSYKRMREDIVGGLRRDSLIVTLRYTPRAGSSTEGDDAQMSEEKDAQEHPVASGDSALFLDAATRFTDAVSAQKEKLSQVDALQQSLEIVNQSIPGLDRESKEKLSAFLAVSQEVDRCPDLCQTEILINQREQAMAESTEASSARKRKECEGRNLEQQLRKAEGDLYNCDQLCKEKQEAVLRMCNSLWTSSSV
jgi:hypothetical protein